MFLSYHQQKQDKQKKSARESFSPFLEKEREFWGSLSCRIKNKKTTKKKKTKKLKKERKRIDAHSGE
jgi:hypothetical protein